MQQPIRPPAPRALTGISGLDDILGGGLAVDRLYLIEGTPGTGKTTLSLQFLLHGRVHGEVGLYVTLSETAAELRNTATSHGWSLDALTIFELVSDAGLDPESEQTVLHPSEVELGETVREVMRQVDELRPARVVFDSLSEMRLLAQSPLRYRRQILALKQFFAHRACTVLMLDDRTADPTDLQLHSIAHGVISLEQIPRDYGAERRRLRVVKMRGMKFRGGFHDFILDTGGLSVFPRLVAAEHHADFRNDTASTGNASLDALLGGGLVAGTNALLAGAVGRRQDDDCRLLRPDGSTTWGAGLLQPVRRRGGHIPRAECGAWDGPETVHSQRAAESAAGRPGGVVAGRIHRPNQDCGRG